MAADQPVTVVFDRAIDRNSLRGRFHVNPALPNCDLDAAMTANGDVPCRVDWLTNRPGFVLTHGGAIFAPNTKYSFSLDAGISASDGTANQLDHHWDITSAPAPQVAATTPADGGTDIPIDTAPAVEFDRPMGPIATATSISLTPPVDQLSIVRNSLDHNRFVLLPGHLLRPRTEYTLAVSNRATDEHGQPLTVTRSVRFTTGGLSSSRHLVATVATSGRPAKQVMMTATIPAQAGEPVPATAVWEEAADSGFSVGEPALSPGSRLLAVVESGAGGSTRLRVIDVASGRDAAVIPGGTFPAWSSGGDLAYGDNGDIAVLRSNGQTTLLPRGDPLLATPVWSRDATMLALPVGTPLQPPHVDLANLAVAARYPVPDLPDGAAVTAPSISPDTQQLALRLDSAARPSLAGTWVVPLGSSAAYLIDAAATPVGFADSTTLLVVDRGDGAPPGLARISLGSGRSALPVAATPANLGSSSVSPDGRQIAFVAVGGSGGVQIWIENGDGSSPQALTDLPADASAAAIGFSA